MALDLADFPVPDQRSATSSDIIHFKYDAQEQAPTRT